MSRPLDIVELDKAGSPARKGSGFHTPRRDAFLSVGQDPNTFLTTTEFAREFGVTDKQVHRWCERWYGPLPAIRAKQGKRMGYRIQPYMRRVARGWQLTQDLVVREAIRRAYMEDGEGQRARDWVLVVGETATLHYTPAEVVVEVTKILPRAAGNKQQVSVLYVGATENTER